MHPLSVAATFILCPAVVMPSTSAHVCPPALLCQSCMVTPVHHVRACLAMQLLSAPLFCLLAAAAEAAEARQVLAALRHVPPQLVVSLGAYTAAPAEPEPSTPADGAAAASVVGAQGPPDTEQVGRGSRVTHATPAAAAAAAAASMAAAGGVEDAESAAAAVSAAAFAPCVSVPLVLGLQHTNSGVLTAACLLCCAVLWPR